MGVKRSIHGACRLGVCLLALQAMPLAAQEAAAPADPTAETLVVDNEIMALVAPVALYPDPLLAVVLQAALFPVDIVQADRFIERYQADQTLEPSPDWDPAVTALLDYPAVLTEMNEHLDWTEPMGDAVYDRLEEVQDAIQDLRQGAYAMGILATNEVQEVVITDGIIEIRPTAPDAIAVPQYDGFALLASLEPVAAAVPAEAPSDETASELADREAELAAREAELAEREAEVAEREQAATETTEEVAAEDVAAEPAYVETAAVDPYASNYAPTEPSYVEAPVYAAAPPPVTYAQPTSPFWGTAGTFVAGAAVGGLLGYAIFDDDDDNNNNNNNDGDYGRGDINIEDSTIVVGGDGDRVSLDKDNKKRVNAELRARRDQGQRTERRDPNRQVAALPDRREANRSTAQRQDISLPERDREGAARVERRETRATPALKAPKQQKAAIADVKRPSQTKKEASRGKESRAKAATKRAPEPQRQLAQRGDGGGGKKGIAPKKGGKKQAKNKSDRGKKSRGGKKRG